MTQATRLSGIFLTGALLAASTTFAQQSNAGITAELAKASKGFEFNLQTQAPRTTNSIPFTSEGTAVVQCAIQPKMKLVVNDKK